MSKERKLTRAEQEEMDSECPDMSEEEYEELRRNTVYSHSLCLDCTNLRFIDKSQADEHELQTGHMVVAEYVPKNWKERGPDPLLDEFLRAANEEIKKEPHSKSEIN